MPSSDAGEIKQNVISN